MIMKLDSELCRPLDGFFLEKCTFGFVSPLL